MSVKTVGKAVAVFAAVIILLALDGVAALEGFPLLLLLLLVALVLLERLRVWLRAQARTNVALLPFMGAALVLLVAFVRGRDLSQALLLVVTLAIVFNILLIALALISETSKRGAKGLAEFAGLTALGLVVGGALSAGYIIQAVRLGGVGMAQP